MAECFNARVMRLSSSLAAHDRAGDSHDVFDLLLMPRKNAERLADTMISNSSYCITARDLDIRSLQTDASLRHIVHRSVGP